MLLVGSPLDLGKDSNLIGRSWYANQRELDTSDHVADRGLDRSRSIEFYFRLLEHCADDCIPGECQVSAVIATATHRNDSTLAELIGNGAKLF